jgi:protein O-mannosyl-transferase
MKLRKYQPAAAIAVLALAASIIGLRNEFTYDDRYIVLLNPVVHSLHRWWTLFAQSYWPQNWSGDGYRPLTMLAFAAEWVAGGGSPMVFHAANIVLYALVALIVFLVARELLPVWAAWIAAALFAVHPVHVEAVANVVGQAELIVALAVLAAVLAYLRDRRSGDIRAGTAVLITFCFAGGCFAKEHGIVLPGLLLAAELTVIHDDRPVAERIRKLRPLYLALFAVALAFVVVRARVLSDHTFGGFAPYTPFNSLRISGPDRALTAITVVPEWIRLLLWPAHLSSEYGPPQLAIAQGFSFTQLPGLMLLVAVMLLGVVLRRRNAVASFGIAWVCVALLPSSNFILPAGIMLAERTLFLPSVGAMLLVGAVIAAAATRIEAAAVRQRPRWLAGLACALVLVAGLARSVLRTTVWRDNTRLFAQAVIDSPDAYRAHYMLGAFHFESHDRQGGEAEYRRAMQLFPYDPAVSFNMAEQYRNAGMCREAIPFYRWTRGLDPEYPVGRTQYAECFLEVAQYDSAKTWILAAVKAGGAVPLLHQMLIAADSAKIADAARAEARQRLAGSIGKLPETVQKAARQH